MVYGLNKRRKKKKQNQKTSTCLKLLLFIQRSWHEKSILPLLGESNAIHHVQVPCSSECFKFLPSFPSEELKFLKSLCL